MHKKHGETMRLPGGKLTCYTCHLQQRKAGACGPWPEGQNLLHLLKGEHPSSRSTAKLMPSTYCCTGEADDYIDARHLSDVAPGGVACRGELGPASAAGVAGAARCTCAPVVQRRRWQRCYCSETPAGMLPKHSDELCSFGRVQSGRFLCRASSTCRSCRRSPVVPVSQH